jgi:YD repeat-containing protein
MRIKMSIINYASAILFLLPQPASTLSYTYDALDRRVGLVDHLGGAYAYAYDVESRLTALTTPWGTAYSFGYDTAGRRNSLASTSGRASTFTYENGLLSALKHAQNGVTLTDLAYDYAVDGQLSGVRDLLAPDRSLTIDYDNLNRLTMVSAGLPVALSRLLLTSLGSPMVDTSNLQHGAGSCPLSLLHALERMKPKSPLGCVFGNNMQMINLQRMRILGRAILMRKAIMMTCFNGGNAGHQQAVAELTIPFNQCYGILTKAWKGK